MSELSLMTFRFSAFICCIIVILSTIQILHCIVRADFMQRIRSPCQRIDGVIINFIFARTSTIACLLSKCLENESALEETRLGAPPPQISPTARMDPRHGKMMHQPSCQSTTSLMPSNHQASLEIYTLLWSMIILPMTF